MIREGILIWPNYSKTACRIFKRIDRDFGWNGIYATKGNEKRIGRFWVDYYEPTQNVVIEYDENHHFDKNGNLKPKDIIRQRWIVNHTKCQFYRIRNGTNYEQFKNFISSNM